MNSILQYRKYKKLYISQENTVLNSITVDQESMHVAVEEQSREICT